MFSAEFYRKKVVKSHFDTKICCFFCVVYLILFVSVCVLIDCIVFGVYIRFV